MRTYYIPSYLREKLQLISTVTFTALWSLVFILCSVPFSHNAWFSLGATQAFGYTAAFFLISLLLVIFSKWIMYLTRDKFRMTYLQYIIWNLAEVALVSLLYTIFTLRGSKNGIISPLSTPFAVMFANAFENTFVCLVIPYIIAGMFFAIADKDKTIRLMNTSDVVSDDPDKGIQKVTLYSNNGELKFSVKLSNLYYIESSDNYVTVWYSDNDGAMKKYMIRSRMKTIEESFRGSSLVRCHRRYIVNIDKVKVLRKERDGYEMELDNDTIPPISITKTYAEDVLGKFKDVKITQS